MRYPSLLLPATLALAACEPDAGNAQTLDAREGAPAAEAPVPPRPLVTPDTPVTIIEPNAPIAASEASAPALLFNGHPVSPLCFAPYLMREDPVESISLDPAACAPGMSATDKDFSPIEGYIGTGFYWDSDPDARGMRPAFIAYRVLGETKDGLALELLGSGGGTGVFSTLIATTRTGDTLHVAHSVAGGDRCNGGINQSAVKNGQLAYAVNITPYDFINLDTDTPPDGIEAYGDLDACAACCMGEALYEGKTFVGVRLPERFVATERPKEQTVQICFDRIMAEQGETQWTAEQYHPLRDRIRRECKHD